MAEVPSTGPGLELHSKSLRHLLAEDEGVPFEVAMAFEVVAYLVGEPKNQVK